jgi:hypothetical protein
VSSADGSINADHIELSDGLILVRKSQLVCLMRLSVLGILGFYVSHIYIWDQVVALAASGSVPATFASPSSNPSFARSTANGSLSSVLSVGP